MRSGPLDRAMRTAGRRGKISHTSPITPTSSDLLVSNSLGGGSVIFASTLGWEAWLHKIEDAGVVVVVFYLCEDVIVDLCTHALWKISGKPRTQASETRLARAVKH